MAAEGSDAFRCDTFEGRCLTDGRSHRKSIFSRFTTLGVTGQGIIDIGPGNSTLRPGLASRSNNLRIIQAACFDKNRVCTFLGSGEQRGAAIWAELACDFPPTVGDGRETLYNTGENV